MILATHELASGALTAAFSLNPLAAFFINLFGHYALDMIPHWHYRHRPHVKEIIAWNETGAPFVKKLLTAGRSSFIKIALDGIAGIALVLLIAQPMAPSLFWGLICGMAGSILPDFIVSLSKVFPNKLFDRANGLHQAAHTKRLLDEKLLLGIGSQAVIALFAAFVLYFSTH